MKNKIIITLILACILAIWGIYTRNSLIEHEEAAKSQWANVENQYQRRSDLIPNLVNIVKGYASHENTTLLEAMEARSRATQATVDFDRLTENALSNYSKAQNEIGTAISRLLVISENYPDLKANQNFLELQAQLEGTENRISVERRRYNNSVNKYNSSVRKFPTLIVARIFGFDNLPYFEAGSNAENTPEVNF